MCNEWWGDDHNGLRKRLLDQVDTSLAERFINWASFMSTQEVNDALIREVASPRSQRVTQGQVDPRIQFQVVVNPVHPLVVPAIALHVAQEQKAQAKPQLRWLCVSRID
jgi:hypothetical protein